MCSIEGAGGTHLGAKHTHTTVDVHVWAMFALDLNIGFQNGNPMESMQNQKLKIVAKTGYNVKSSFTLDVIVPSSSATGRAIGTYEKGFPLAATKNLFRRAFMGKCSTGVHLFLAVVLLLASICLVQSHPHVLFISGPCSTPG